MNEGAFRGVVLVAIAVVIGLILLGSGLDDTVSTAREDSSAAGTDRGGGGGDDETEPTSVGSPVEPASIVVLVANGAGVSGAAGTVSAQLQGLGYQVLDPIDGSDPSLDTVYYQTSPDTQAQAERVAADLNLDPSAVLPYPGPDAAPAPIGLSQVLVVLGSAGTLAGTPAG